MNKIILLHLFLVFLACGKKNTSSDTYGENANSTLSLNYHVRVSPVDTGYTSSIVRASGIILSSEEAKPSFKTGGVISNTYFKEGDPIQKGMLMAKLNMAEIDAQVYQAQEAVNKANRDLNRVKNLYADSVATLEQLQNAGTGLEMAEKTLQIAKFNSNYSEVRAPISGKVMKQILHSGEIAGPGMPIYIIMGTAQNDWKLVAGLTDQDWGRLKKGDLATVTLDAYPGLRFPAKIDRLADAGNPLNGTFDVDIKLALKDTRLAAGLLAKAEIIPSKSVKQILIPVEALVDADDKMANVFTVQDGKAKRIAITILKWYGQQVAVSSGLEGIREVITMGSTFLEDGDPVTIDK